MWSSGEPHSAPEQSCMPMTTASSCYRALDAPESVQCTRHLMNWVRQRTAISWGSALAAGLCCPTPCSTAAPRLRLSSGWHWGCKVYCRVVSRHSKGSCAGCMRNTGGSKMILPRTSSWPICETVMSPVLPAAGEHLEEMLPIVYTPTVGKGSNSTATNTAAAWGLPLDKPPRCCRGVVAQLRPAR